MVTGGPGTDPFGASRGRGGFRGCRPVAGAFCPVVCSHMARAGVARIAEKRKCLRGLDRRERGSTARCTDRALTGCSPACACGVYPGTLPIRRRRNHRPRIRNAHRSAGIAGRARRFGVSSSVTLTGSLELLPVLASCSAPRLVQTDRARWADACRTGPRADSCGALLERGWTAAHFQHASWSFGAARAPGMVAFQSAGVLSVRVDSREATSQRMGAGRASSHMPALGRPPLPLRIAVSHARPHARSRAASANGLLRRVERVMAARAPGWPGLIRC